MRALRRLAGRADALVYTARAARRGRRGSLERALGLELHVPPSVLNPVLFRTGILLARATRREISPGERLLDMGAGSGIVGLFAARRGAVVVAVDKNPAAARAALVNAMLNGVFLDVREGDLFAPCADECFDLLAFNPPFFERAQGGDLSLALADGPGLPTLSRFLRDSHDHLSSAGRILVAGSSHGALASMRKLYETHGFAWTTVLAVERVAERLVVDRLAPRLAKAAPRRL